MAIAADGDARCGECGHGRFGHAAFGIVDQQFHLRPGAGGGLQPLGKLPGLQVGNGPAHPVARPGGKLAVEHGSVEPGIEPGPRCFTRQHPVLPRQEAPDHAAAPAHQGIHLPGKARDQRGIGQFDQQVVAAILVTDFGDDLRVLGIVARRVERSGQGMGRRVGKGVDLAVQVRVDLAQRAGAGPVDRQRFWRQAGAQDGQHGIVGPLAPGLPFHCQPHVHPARMGGAKRMGQGLVAEVIGRPAYPAAGRHGVHPPLQQVAQGPGRAVRPAEVDVVRGRGNRHKRARAGVTA